ncbi:MAG: SsrA-binding protein SmpB [Dehalococcoidia bacterium]|nr:SsrA-binding protein SmpB [Dehalococcoidia bacterium]
MVGKEKTIATNRKARHDYFVDETYEAGIILTGTEIKSARAGRVNLRDSYVQVKNGELWLIDTHIAPYQQAGRNSHEPKRPRKLLMHRREINRLQGKVQEKGYTIIPLRLYLRNNKWAKVEIALARGKKLYDKRQAIRKHDAEREMERALAGRSKRL